MQTFDSLKVKHQTVGATRGFLGLGSNFSPSFAASLPAPSLPALPPLSQGAMCVAALRQHRPLATL